MRNIYPVLATYFILVYVASFLIPQEIMKEYETAILLISVSPFSVLLFWAIFKDEQEKEKGKENAE
jgi:hypothetical protein